MIELLIWVLFLIVIFGAIFYLIQRVIPLPDPWRTAALIVVGIIFLLILINLILPMPYWPRRPLP